jgi:hypothetical protein
MTVACTAPPVGASILLSSSLKPATALLDPHPGFPRYRETRRRSRQQQAKAPPQLDTLDERLAERWWKGEVPDVEGGSGPVDLR